MAKTDRRALLEKLAEVFRRNGYAETSLAMISEATGLGRASLYHHFPAGKEQMAHDVFDCLDEQIEREILEPLRGQGSPEEKILACMRGLDGFYSGGSKNCLLGAIVLSGGSDRFAEEIKASFSTWIESFEAVLREAGQERTVARRRAELAFGQIHGALVVARGLGDDTHFTRVLEELPRQMLATP